MTSNIVVRDGSSLAFASLITTILEVIGVWNIECLYRKNFIYDIWRRV